MNQWCRRAAALILLALPARWAASQPPASPAPVARARQLLAADSATEAARVLSATIATAPDNAAYHLWLAAAYTQQGSNLGVFRQTLMAGRIRRELQRAVAIDPASVDAHSELARFYLTAPGLLGGSFAKAEAEAREVARANPARAGVLRGYIAHHRGDAQTAERELRAAVALHPDSAWASTALAALLGEQERNDEAFALWARSVALDSTDSESYYQMGSIAANTGTHLAEGARALEQLLARAVSVSDKSRRAAAANKLGLIYEKQGRRADAKRLYQAADSLRPSNSYKAALSRVSR